MSSRKKALKLTKISNIPQRPDPRRQWQGRVNKAQGHFFEQLIDQSCEFYRTAGRAVIEKTPEPFHITRSLGNGKFQGNFAKAAQPDYKGVLRGGDMIAIEAKTTTDEKIQQSRVSSEQTKMLNEYQDMGARCYILVSFRIQRFFKVPWGVWRDMKALYGTKYMEIVALEPYECKFNGRYIEFL